MKPARLLLISVCIGALSVPFLNSTAGAQTSRRPLRFVTDDQACEAETLVSTGGAAPRGGSTLAIRWAGFSNFELAYKGTVLLLDAYFDRGAVYPPLGFRSDDIKRADAILIGHGHADHMADAAAVAIRTGAPVIGAKITADKLAEQSLPIAQIRTVTGRGGEVLRFGAFTVEPILGRHGEVAVEAQRAFQAALDGTNGKRSDAETAEQIAIRAKGATSDLLGTEGTITYLITLDNGFRLIYRDSGGKVTDWERVVMARIGAVDVALVALPGYITGQYVTGAVTERALEYLDTYKPLVFIPAHHDAARDELWRPTEPVFQALKDKNPAVVTVSKSYREAVCFDSAER